MKRRRTSRDVALGACTAGTVWVAALLLAGLATFPARADEKAATTPVQLPGVTAAVESPAEKVFISSQPSKETLEALAKKGVKVVVNLRRPEEMAKVTWDEKSAAESLGMTYISVPMSTSLPKEDGLKTLLDTLGDSQQNPVFLHCASGNRAGAIWALYLGARKGQAADAAIAEGKQAGLNSEALEHIVRNRIAAWEKK